MITTFAVYVENKPGVLTRVSSLFRRRAFNIESLTVGHTDKPSTEGHTVVLTLDEAIQHSAATAESRTHVMQLVDVFRARVVDVAPDSLIIEITGTEDKIDGLLEVLRPYGVMEMVRTGRVAMSRGIRSATAAQAGEPATAADDENVFHSV